MFDVESDGEDLDYVVIGQPILRKNIHTDFNLLIWIGIKSAHKPQFPSQKHNLTTFLLSFQFINLHILLIRFAINPKLHLIVLNIKSILAWLAWAQGLHLC